MPSRVAVGGGEVVLVEVVGCGAVLVTGRR